MIARRSFGVVSPLLVATVTCGACEPRASICSRIPAKGTSRFFATSTPSAFNGEIYNTRTPLRAWSAALRDRSESMANRNAERVFPEPVGAMTSTFSRRPIAGHANRCASVGSPNTRENHTRVGSLNIAIHSHICSIISYLARDCKCDTLMRMTAASMPSDVKHAKYHGRAAMPTVAENTANNTGLTSVATAMTAVSQPIMVIV